MAPKTSKKAKKNANALIQSCTKEELKEIFNMIVRHGRMPDVGAPSPAAQERETFCADDIAEASIHLGTTIDIDLAHSMIEYIREYCNDDGEMGESGHVTRKDFERLIDMIQTKEEH